MKAKATAPLGESFSGSIGFRLAALDFWARASGAGFRASDSRAGIRPEASCQTLSLCGGCACSPALKERVGTPQGSKSKPAILVILGIQARASKGEQLGNCIRRLQGIAVSKLWGCKVL